MTLFTDTQAFHDWLAELVAMPSTPQAENLYENTPVGNIRLHNLKEYFKQMAVLSPEIILIGEAPGYQGTRRTGVPFGSEHIITGGMPGVSFFQGNRQFKLAYNDRLYKEPTSTIMWRTISQYEKLPLLWAVYPLHPHQPDMTETNRTPTRREVEVCKNHLLKLLGLTGVKTVLALGNTAKTTLDSLDIPAQKLRHPARGGGPVFARQLDTFMSSQVDAPVR